jgi:tyrosine-specific transport protein
MFIFLYYCLMIAYFAAGAPMLASALEALTTVRLTGWQIYLFFGAIFSLIVGIGPKSIDRVNVIITCAMVLSWTLLLAMAGPEVENNRLLRMEYRPMFLAMPVLFSAFGFHNVIPSLSMYLKRNIRVLRLSILCGTSIPFMIYLLWQWLIIGSLPSQEINEVLQAGRPVTEALQAFAGKPYIAASGKFFAFFAIVTSILGVSFSMVDFLGDGLNMTRRGYARLLLTIMTFFPPFLFATLNPGIFNTALGIAGGFGEAYLNGLLPAMLVWRGIYQKKFNLYPGFRVNKIWLSTLIFCAFMVMGIELWQLVKNH